ncbi:MAG: threonine--tRNA ligase [Elusimicrobiota bacterium]
MEVVEKMHSREELSTLRHSASHIMAQAVQELFPGTKLAIGPSIDDGFYYDFERSGGSAFTVEDFGKIEQRMREIVNENTVFVRTEIGKPEAIKMFAELGEKYKVELIDGIPDATVSMYTQGKFTDLCRGPHMNTTGEIKYFKLLSVAGAYWRGDEKREQLQRIYATAFFTKQELEDYLKLLEEAKLRDHRKLGRDLDLFGIYEEAGPGLIFWHPKGALIRKTIEDFWREEHLKNGYDILFTPHIAKIDLWQISGHWDFYRENMYSPMEIDKQDYEIKPMNCPFHILVYKSALRSYRELPFRWCELGTVYRYERSGVLHGLMRVRGFTQDDAHIFCRLDQIEDEVVNALNFVVYILKTFGFENYEVYISTRPPNSVGSTENWSRAENALKTALEKIGLTYQIDPGAGVFYGPKIDIKIKDCLNRTWQCSTIQVDFNLPERFNVTYRNNEGKDETVIMIHRALMGSLERFFGVLIEHYAGAFPVWLSPVQVLIATITDKQDEYAKQVCDVLKSNGIRAKLDLRNEKIGLKIREAELQKVPFTIVLGKREVENKVLSVRQHKKGDLGSMDLSSFTAQVTELIKTKK